MWERSFEKKEKIFAQIPPEQSEEIECHKCPGLMKECSALNEKIKEL